MWHMDRRIDRRIVALAAAYAVVLNTLLPVLTAILPPAAIGEIGLAVICSGGGAGSAADPGAPEKPQPLCPCDGACAMPGCAAPALPDDDAAGAGATCVSVGLAGLGLDGRQNETFWPGGSKLARGPPIA
jgi:hypothetical protein